MIESKTIAKQVEDFSAVLGLIEAERVIELDHSLDIDEVTEIFIRINSKGTPLSQSDFVMSKMASDTAHGGNMLRKVVDYFCHLAVKPDFYPQMVKDKDFENTEFSQKIRWLAKDNEDIYDPDYGDILRVAFMYSFNRGRLSDLLAIKGAGFKSSKLINSQMTLDFAYTLYLKLQDDPNIHQGQIKRLVQKWFVLSTLTRRYVGSPESVMSRDIRNIAEKGFMQFAQEAEVSALSDTFWQVTLPQNLETTSVNSPAFNTFLAAQGYLKSNYAMVQNKFHYAITKHTAAEIIYHSADHEKEHMGLTTWKNGYFDYIEDLIEKNEGELYCGYTDKRTAQKMHVTYSFERYRD